MTIRGPKRSCIYPAQNPIREWDRIKKEKMLHAAALLHPNSLITERINTEKEYQIPKAIPRVMNETKTMIHTVKNTADGSDIIEMKGIQLPNLKCDIIPFYNVNRKRIFPFWVEIERVDL